jgi:4-hydroxy-tetrahydrodipicolinate reductase
VCGRRRHEQKGNAAVGLDVGLAARIGRLEAPTFDALDKALTLKPDVVIDFTSAEASLLHAADCARTKIALVVGSTGFSPDDKKAMAAAAKFVPIVMANTERRREPALRRRRRRPRARPG